MGDHADRHLLFGLLALQNGLVQQGQLVSAFHAWTCDKARPLAVHLVASGYLNDAQRAAVEALVALHVEKHGSPERSLAALSVGRSTRESLEGAAEGDPEVETTLAHVGSGTNESGDPDRTTTYSVGTATSDGRRFRVLRPHARGGLGAVFVALDGELNREVALKQILDRHADDPVSRQRFVLEAEITGGLEHPGIVPVYGLGTYGGGRPYYAMRFVKGGSLKEAIERFHRDGARMADPGRRSLELRKLLRRFQDVCNAIEYAHSRGVLHRDIKPGNVIVGKHGETLVVDWGLAKLVGRADPGAAPEDRTLAPASASGSAETLPGSALGTPAYMSPEQARGDLEALGPRSDVYGLGATLYYLLTGKPPFEGDVGTVLQAVQRGEFPPPRRHDPTLDPALEAVCLKAMALRPDDRYPSARGLAEDVERWMADESVTAWPEPLSRRARRWARRHRTAVTAAAAAILAGLVGLAAVAAVEARANTDLRAANAATTHEKARAERALAETTRSKQATDAALARSEQSLRRAEAVLRFLKDDILAAARPEGQDGGLGVDVTVRKALDAAEPKIADRFRSQPAVEAEVRDTLGSSYWYLGDLRRALRQFERATSLRVATLGPDHPDTLTSRNNLAVAYLSAGRTAEALPVIEETLRLREAKLGPDHPDTLESRLNLAGALRDSGRVAEAVRLDEGTLKLTEAKLGPDHRNTLAGRLNLAQAYGAAGRDAEAARLDEETLRRSEAKLGPDHPLTLISRENLAQGYRRIGRDAEAARLTEEALRRSEAKLGPDHPDTLITRTNLAQIDRALGRTAEAIRLDEGTLKIREAKLGPEHPETLVSRINLALSYRADGRTGEAVRMLEAVLKIREAKLGPEHRDTVDARDSLALAYSAAGRNAEAVALWERVLQSARRLLGPRHPERLSYAGHLATGLEGVRRWDEAQALRREVLGQRRTIAPPGSPILADDLDGLARNLDVRSRPSEAEGLLRESLAIRVREEPDHWRRFQTESLLGGALLGQGRYAEAEPLVVGGYQGLKAREASIPLPSRYRLPEAAERVVRLYGSWGKPDQAATWKARLGLADLPDDVFARP